MPDTKTLNAEELNKFTQVLSTHKAIENAAFTAAMIRDGWRKISKTTEELGVHRRGAAWGRSPHEGRQDGFIHIHGNLRGGRRTHES